MNKLSVQKRAQMIGMLVEGNSLRSISRMADCSINTVTKLLVDIGTACAEYQDKVLRDLSCTLIQCDEIWNFCYCKEKNIPADRRGEFGIGDVYTWVAIDSNTKLVPSFMVGKRDANYGHAFMEDLASRLKNRVQLTTDGHKVYLSAVENAFGSEIDYAMLIKVYGGTTAEDQRKYSPAECTSIEMVRITGNPDEDFISTSHVERQNLTMRMGMRRFTRLTNAFSKKIDNLFYSVALHFMFYNFGRIHKSLRVTPAMEAGVSNHVWSLEEIAKLIN